MLRNILTATFSQTQAMMISTQHLLPSALSPTVPQEGGAPVTQPAEASSGSGAPDGMKHAILRLEDLALNLVVN